jgi:hypothetical protein
MIDVLNHCYTLCIIKKNIGLHRFKNGLHVPWLIEALSGLAEIHEYSFSVDSYHAGFSDMIILLFSPLIVSFTVQEIMKFSTATSFIQFMHYAFCLSRILAIVLSKL